MQKKYAGSKVSMKMEATLRALLQRKKMIAKEQEKQKKKKNEKSTKTEKST